MDKDSRESWFWAGGVGFLDVRKSGVGRALGRMYMISLQQFIEVVDQENGKLGIDAVRERLDIEKMVKAPFQPFELFSSWYGTLLCLGKEDGVPILTFTCNQEGNAFDTRTVPSPAYLRVIMRGLLQAGVPKKEVVAYAFGLPAVSREKGLNKGKKEWWRTGYTMKDLQALLADLE